MQDTKRKEKQMPYTPDGGWEPASGEHFARLSPSEVADLQDYANENPPPPNELGAHPVAQAIWDAFYPRRRAVVIGFGATPEVIAHYLPSNYRVIEFLEHDKVLIEGTDRMGWTLEDYIIPRLASGWYVCKEVEVP
jgi:hypothetical protein